MKNILLIFLLLFEIGFGFSQTKHDRGYRVKVGDSVTNFGLQFANGKTSMLYDIHKKVVVLQFTASWCSVCRKEMPHLEKEIWLANKEKSFILIGVDYDESLDKVHAFKKQMKITYPVALDSGAEIFSRFAYKNSGVTRNVVIDSSWHIAFLTRLYDRTEFEAMKKKIEELIGVKH